MKSHLERELNKMEPGKFSQSGPHRAVFRTRDIESQVGPHVRVKVQNIHGLHARPAAAIVRALESFSSDVAIIFRKKTANARSVLGLLMLGVPCGSSITIKAIGEDAQEAVNSLETLVKHKFYEGDV